MLSNEEELREKINGFLRRKEAKYPELALATKRDKLQREYFKSGIDHNLHFAFGSRH
jgi:hypothetical protein